MKRSGCPVDGNQGTRRKTPTMVRSSGGLKMAQSVASSAEIDSLRSDAWEHALHAHGTSEVFRRRAERLRWPTRARDFLGIAIPLTIGFVVVNTNEQVRPIAEWVLGFLGFLQLLMAVWSLVARWDDDRAYSIVATRSNSTLRAEWESVAKAQANQVEAEYERVQNAEKVIEQEDLTREISDKEKRYGMRAGLFLYRKACAVCKEVPTSMKPTNCDVCGNF